jgi:serine/threonine protein kinase
MKNLIGSGGYSKVYSVDTDRTYAIKEIDKNLSEAAIREIYFLRNLAHPNILKIMRVEASSATYNIHMTKYQCDLHNYKVRGDTDVVRIAYGLISAVDYLHRSNIIHCDIKPGNILIDVGPTPILCDFGLTVFDVGCEKDNVVQTVTYRAPEIDVRYTHSKYTPKIDIWSIGCVLYELYSGKMLFEYVGKDQTVAICDVFCDYKKHRSDSDRMALTELKNTHVEARLRSRIPKCWPWYLRMLSFCLTPNSNYRSSSDMLMRIITDAIYADYPEIQRIPECQPLRIQPRQLDEMTVTMNVPLDIVMKLSTHALNVAEGLMGVLAIDTPTIDTPTIDPTAKKIAALYIAHTVCGESSRLFKNVSGSAIQKILNIQRVGT